MCRGIHGISVQVVGINKPMGQRYSNYKLSAGRFWTHKIKTKSKYISISNILHLLSAPVSIPCVEEFLGSLVIISPSNCEFFLVSDFHLIVDSSFHPSRALTTALNHSSLRLGQYSVIFVHFLLD